MYNYPNQFPVKQQLQDIEPLEHFQPIVFHLPPEARAALEHALAALTEAMGWREQGEVVAEIKRVLARG